MFFFLFQTPCSLRLILYNMDIFTIIVAEVPTTTTYPVPDGIQLWKNFTDISYLKDNDRHTGVSLSPSEPVLLLLLVGPFSSMTLRVFSKNLYVDNNGCESPLIVASHKSEKRPGKTPCLPVCNGLLRCQRKGNVSAKTPAFSDFTCLCNQAMCRGVILAVQPSAVINPDEPAAFCHLEVVQRVGVGAQIPEPQHAPQSRGGGGGGGWGWGWERWLNVSCSLTTKNN